MRLDEVIKVIQHAKNCEEINLKNRKNNINHSYTLAKHDFRCIENMEDVIETYSYILEKLDDLQDRIVERNSLNIENL